VVGFEKCNPLKPSGYYMYHLLQRTKTLRFHSRVYLCVSHGSMKYEANIYILFRRSSVFKV
jgi:hypothetical protein